MSKRPIRFKWIDWNREKVTAHGVTPTEAEDGVRHDKETQAILRPTPSKVRTNLWQ